MRSRALRGDSAGRDLEATPTTMIKRLRLDEETAEAVEAVATKRVDEDNAVIDE